MRVIILDDSKLPEEEALERLLKAIEENPLSERELDIISYCLAYAEDPVGLPGHALMVLVAKLWDMLAD
jgi:hypothetical protein